jgi:hypothetical protein
LKVSHREKARLSKEIEEKLTKEIEQKLARELEEKQDTELEETKEHILLRDGGNASATASNSNNLTFVYGCEPAAGVKGNSKLIADVINLYRTDFDPEKGLIVIPDVYSNVISSDAKFEVVTTVEAKKLVLEREDDLIGHKRIIYVIDKADLTKEPTRKVTIDFFKVSLGFTDDEILFCDK